LLKKEFDIHRAAGKPHPLMTKYQIDAVPLAHEKMDTWRYNFTGVQYYHEPTDFLVFGAVDDIWVNSKKELHVVDYKTTSTKEVITLTGGYKEAYKRQMEVYQWLLRKNDFVVSDLGYFVYCNGLKDKKAFDGKLEFDIKLIPYEGKTDWIEAALVEIKKTLMSDEMPESSPECDYCVYRNWVIKVMQPFLRKEKKAKKMELPKKPKEGLGF